MHSERFEELAALQALGIPLGADAEEFARHLAGCEVCEALLVDFRVSAAALATSAPPVRASPAVRERLLRSLGPSVATPHLDGARARFVRRSSWAPRVFAAAAVLLLLVLVTDDARIRREREDLRSQRADVSDRLSTAERSLARRDLQARVLESDDVRMLFLGGKDPQPQARAKVFWSAKARRGVLVAANLQPLQAGRQYELWVFSAGKPVPAGVFDVDPAGRVLVESPEMSAVDSAEKFAVTVEPRGGVPAPTGPIVLVGS
ncbi:MAG: anti-sigma factor [Acidobacteriota bacterium]